MIKEFAPAKINLSLHITGKRADGYHTLNSIIAFADIGDEIILEPAKEFSFEVEGPKELENDNNLVVKAVHLMAEKYNRKPDFKITLMKNLPIASGIGGGSADAAATLRAIKKHWNVNDDLTDIAIKLGADVPVCLMNKSHYVTGIGEKLEPVTIPPMHILLVNPGKACSTAEVFSKFPATYKPEQPAPKNIDLKKLENDLTAAACEIVPEIKDILKTLNDHSPIARLSGSGATCFALFENAADAEKAAQKIQNPNWWIKTGKLIS